MNSRLLGHTNVHARPQPHRQTCDLSINQSITHLCARVAVSPPHPLTVVVDFSETAWCSCLYQRRFDTNKDNVLSFQEFCLVADAAIDGDKKIAPPTLTLYPPPVDKSAPTIAPAEVSAQLRALLAAAPPQACLGHCCILRFTD
jgi:hypothetical protein